MRTNQKQGCLIVNLDETKKATNVVSSTFVGLSKDGLDKSRTCDPHLVEVVLSQLSYKTIMKF